jgi:hypothetical protein
MLKSSGTLDGKVWFEYRTSALSPVTRVEWNENQEIALFPPEITLSLFAREWASVPTEAQINAYNGLVKAAEAPAVAPAAAVAEAPVVAPAAEEPAAIAEPAVETPIAEEPVVETKPVAQSSKKR